MSTITKLKAWAKKVKRDAVILWFATKDPATPWIAKALGVFVVAYALSPIDLIPDFVPVIGFLDDVLLLPGLVWLAIKLVPESVRLRCQIQADEWLLASGQKPKSWVGAALIVAIWLGFAYAVWRWWIY